jgi:hypothetical protein
MSLITPRLRQANAAAKAGLPSFESVNLGSPSPQRQGMTSQGTALGRFQPAISSRNLQNAETAAKEMGGLLLSDALSLCELLAATDPKRYERTGLAVAATVHRRAAAASRRGPRKAKER